MPMKELIKRKHLGTFRFLQLKGNLIDFASNDYLGLAKSNNLRQAVFNEWKSLKSFGSTGSRLLTGNNSYVHHLEESIATFHGFEAGLIFNCGYMANLGLASSIASKDDVFLYDTNIHASLREGIRMSRAKAFPFRHNDVKHLETRLKKIPKNGNLYICIESVYSTDGSIAPLGDIFHLSQTYGAHLIVDEAHAIGVLGKDGRGIVFDSGLGGEIFAQIVTFGKALGAFGAIILGNQSLKEILINFAKPFIYTTALPFPCLAAIKCSYELFPQLETERNHLQNLIQIANFSKTPIQPIPVKNNSAAHTLVSKISHEGFDVRAFLSPTVPRGKEILRITLHTFNSKEELEKLLKLMRQYV